MRLIASGVSVTGPRHLDLGEPNQDAMIITGGRNGCIAAVADGLGSRARSDVGARVACQVSRRVLRTVSSNPDLVAALPLIHQQWLEAIKPTIPEDAATTLLFSRITSDGSIYAGQLGDGLLLMKCAGEFRCVTSDRIAFGNQTWALESTYKQEKWSSAQGRLTEPGDGVVLMTDGVGDDLERIELADFFETLYQNISIRNRRRGRRWLQSELSDWATPLHSDDKTLVTIFRTSR